jgi:S-DNA-T family DNA segregation ATPase FtsK/SpoIIIE
VALAPHAAHPEIVRQIPWHPTARLTGFVSRRSPAAREATTVWASEGARVIDVDAYAADPSVAADGRTVVVGEPDDWQRHWRLLSDVRGDHDLAVDLSCAAELRVLTGLREAPPYCDPGRGRAWLFSAGSAPVRIVLPDADVRANRHGGSY